MIKKAKVDHIQGFLVRSGGCRVFHLQFANDTRIFCDAHVRQLAFLRCILRCFEAMTDLNVNLAKREMFHVGEMVDIDCLALVVGCKMGTFPHLIWDCRWGQF